VQGGYLWGPVGSGKVGDRDTLFTKSRDCALTHFMPCPNPAVLTCIYVLSAPCLLTCVCLNRRC
jgi:hypothetical protein